MNRAERRQMERKAKKGQPSVGKNGVVQSQAVISLDTPAGRIESIPADFQALFQMNPLALEQMKGVLLNRALAATHGRLKELEGKQRAVSTEQGKD